jgi:hypothetical protein
MVARGYTVDVEKPQRCHSALRGDFDKHESKRRPILRFTDTRSYSRIDLEVGS